MGVPGSAVGRGLGDVPELRRQILTSAAVLHSFQKSLSFRGDALDEKQPSSAY